MKKRRFLALLLFVVVVSGCSNEKPNDVKAENEGKQDIKQPTLQTELNGSEKKAENKSKPREQNETAVKENEKSSEKRQQQSGDQTKHKLKSDANANQTQLKNAGVEPKKVNQPQQYSNTNLSTIDMRLPQQNSAERDDKITHIVLHFISNAAVKPNDPYQVQDIRNLFINYGVSAHYLIGREGDIYLLVPENRIAFHAGKGGLANFPSYNDRLNDYSIGIEIMAIGTEKEMASIMPSQTYHSIEKSQIGFTNAQYESLNRLLDDIVKRNPHVKRDRKHIIGHDEYAPNRKTDPGSLFKWSNIGL